MPAVTIHLLASDMMQEVKAAGTSSDESAAEQVCFPWCRCGVRCCHHPAEHLARACGPPCLAAAHPGHHQAAGELTGIACELLLLYMQCQSLLLLLSCQRQAACDDGKLPKAGQGKANSFSSIRDSACCSLWGLAAMLKSSESRLLMSCNAAGALERPLCKAPAQAGPECPGRPAQRPVPARHHPPARALERQQCHRAEVGDQDKFGLPAQCAL